MYSQSAGLNPYRGMAGIKVRRSKYGYQLMLYLISVGKKLGDLRQLRRFRFLKRNLLFLYFLLLLGKPQKNICLMAGPLRPPPSPSSLVAAWTFFCLKITKNWFLQICSLCPLPPSPRLMARPLGFFFGFPYGLIDRKKDR